MNTRAKTSAATRAYPDMHDHIAALDEAGFLIRVDGPINKDTELHPLVRWQFRGGMAEADRKAWLFTNIVDSKGKKYDMPVLVGATGSSPGVYSVGMGVPVDEINPHWEKARNNPIDPVIVEDAPCQEIIIEGAALDEPGNGLDGLPTPISTPGWDNAPYLTGLGYQTRDPDTGVHNLGTYRAQVKTPRRLGINTSTESRNGGYVHWLKYKERGEPMPAAYVIGGPPSVAYTAMCKFPEAVDEVAVAGGLVGSPINVVRCRTIDLLVPAEAEIVVEGLIDTEYLEPEAPFGESHGHVNTQEFNGFMEVTAITRRKDAVFMSYLSQVHPNETTGIRAIELEYGFRRHIQEHLGIKGIIKVVTHRPLTGNRKIIFVVVERGIPRTEIWRALYGVMTQLRSGGKIVFAVNDDIDPHNLDSVMWAMAFRCSPHEDMHILKHQDRGHGPSEMAGDEGDSALLVDATLKQDYPPISLPKREYMERARDIWEQMGLPAITPEVPWFGYSLGDWPEALEQEAARAVAGDYWETGARQAQRRRKDVAMNTDVTEVEGKETP
jgi:4-hydroxy-3-polyprenylbenzoate decarboxylase